MNRAGVHPFLFEFNARYEGAVMEVLLWKRSVVDVVNRRV
jgi:hypothetical protein